MPNFSVLRRVDAFVDYVAVVDADTEDAACQKAYEDETLFVWEEVGTHCFDARVFVALDGDGNEVESTQRGDF